MQPDCPFIPPDPNRTRRDWTAWLLLFLPILILRLSQHDQSHAAPHSRNQPRTLSACLLLMHEPLSVLAYLSVLREAI